MLRILPVIKRLYLALALLGLMLAALPAVPVAAEGNTPFTPAQQRQSERLAAQYIQLHSDINDLGYLYETVNSYRNDYVGFLTSEQFHQRNTTILESNLAAVDNMVNLGLSAQQRALEELGYPNRLDFTGEGVTDINAVSNEINTATTSYLTSRSYATRAIFYMHSALLQYHYLTGLDVPEIPKVRAPSYCLSCRANQ